MSSVFQFPGYTEQCQTGQHVQVYMAWLHMDPATEQGYTAQVWTQSMAVDTNTMALLVDQSCQTAQHIHI